jgi:hypothetical protein
VHLLQARPGARRQTRAGQSQLTRALAAVGDRHPAASDPRPFRLERSSSWRLAKAFGLERLLISLSACLAVERGV